MTEKPILTASTGGVIHLPLETQYATHGIVSRTLLQSPTTRVVLFGFSAGQELTEHTSPYRALVQILSGKCLFTLDHVPHEVTAGDLIHMPPGAPHALRAITDFSMSLTLVKEPVN